MHTILLLNFFYCPLIKNLPPLMGATHSRVFLRTVMGISLDSWCKLLKVSGKILIYHERVCLDSLLLLKYYLHLLSAHELSGNTK